MTKLGKNGIDLGYGDDVDDDDDDDVNSLEFGGSIEMGAVPTPASENAKAAVKRKFLFFGFDFWFFFRFGIFKEFHTIKGVDFCLLVRPTHLLCSIVFIIWS